MIYRMCIATKHRVKISVRSLSSDSVYEVTGYYDEGNFKCGCKGFQYRGKCKHFTCEHIRCKWHIPLSVDECDDKRCPVCGSDTVLALCGPFYDWDVIDEQEKI